MEAYCKELPGARTFMENFFLSSEDMDIPHLFQNYLMDLRLYSPTNRTIRENPRKMYEAFAAVSGLGESATDALNMVYGDGQNLFKEA